MSDNARDAKLAALIKFLVLWVKRNPDAVAGDAAGDGLARLGASHRRPRTGAGQMSDTEHLLQVQVLDYLYYNAKRDVYALSIPNAGHRSLRMGARMKAEGLRAGVADLCIMLPEGRVAWLEMKTIKGRLSASQKGFAAICERLSHPYAVARTLDEAKVFFSKHGVLK